MRIVQQLWRNELASIAQENDFMLQLLANLQTEHLLQTRYEEQAGNFFNHFQYFSAVAKHLQNELSAFENQRAERENSQPTALHRYDYFREEMDRLENKYSSFKNNFKSFLNYLALQSAGFVHS
ncbi:hypothetical protein [Emticicia sp. 17c]|uniref:hypothetical protein n=1 Tax=Emticicia sp. 17c TaxID=3127704 RepID=UPI00301C7425